MIYGTKLLEMKNKVYYIAMKELNPREGYLTNISIYNYNGSIRLYLRPYSRRRVEGVCELTDSNISEFLSLLSDVTGDDYPGLEDASPDALGLTLFERFFSTAINMGIENGLVNSLKSYYYYNDMYLECYVPNSNFPINLSRLAPCFKYAYNRVFNVKDDYNEFCNKIIYNNIDYSIKQLNRGEAF